MFGFMTHQMVIVLAIGFGCQHVGYSQKIQAACLQVYLRKVQRSQPNNH